MCFEFLYRLQIKLFYVKKEEQQKTQRSEQNVRVEKGKSSSGIDRRKRGSESQHLRNASGSVPQDEGSRSPERTVGN